METFRASLDNESDEHTARRFVEGSRFVAATKTGNRIFNETQRHRAVTEAPVT